MVVVEVVVAGVRSQWGAVGMGLNVVASHFLRVVDGVLLCHWSMG